MKKLLIFGTILLMPLGFIGCSSSDDTKSTDRCQAITQKGEQCKRAPAEGSIYCWQHQN